MAEYYPHWINDPGHGWLVVPAIDVERSGVELSGVGSYYDITRDLVYLEEDVDANNFRLAATDAGLGSYTNLPLRDIDDFSDRIRRHGLKALPKGKLWPN